MEASEAPRAGDLLFLRSKDFGTPFSVVVQKIVDRGACSTDRDFGHVAIAISEYLALEAVPTGKHDDCGFEIPGAVSRGFWTGSELRGGVRLAPIADIVIPALSVDSDLAVLRAPEPHDLSLALSISGPTVLRVLGSRYSADGLKNALLEELKREFGSVFDRFADKINLSSTPTDFSTRLALDAELRTKISDTFPDYILPEVARAYFCSQLVTDCLQSAGVLAGDGDRDLLTPTGLYALLCGSWLDVTDIYSSGPNPDYYLDWSPSDHQAHYVSQLHMAELSLNAKALELQGQFIKASMDKMNRLCRKITADLQSRYKHEP